MEQGLALVPKMLQSIEILQLSTIDLLARIEIELAQNELLVAESTDLEPQVEGPVSDAEPAVDWRAAAADGEDPKHAFLHNLPSRAPSLLDHVRTQLLWLDLPAATTAAVEALVARLDHRGLLTEPADIDEATGALAILQSLEPRGLGARDPIAAMLLQAEGDPDFALIEVLLRKHLDDLARNKIPEVARAIGQSVAEVQLLLERIRGLDPHPGAAFATPDETEVVRPEVTARLALDVDHTPPVERLEVEVDGKGLPELGIEADYVAMLDDVDVDVDADVRRYLNDKMRAARELISAVEQRRRTLARVSYAVMRHQIAFLRHGPSAVRRLGMEAIGQELDLHPSTISRAIAGKSVVTDHGVFRLRDFFDADRNTAAEGGDDAGRMAIRDRIRAMIDDEDPGKPLSDDEIVSRLSAGNVKVARRTVAKYRKELGFPSSWRRRKHR